MNNLLLLLPIHSVPITADEVLRYAVGSLGSIVCTAVVLTAHETSMAACLTIVLYYPVEHNAAANTILVFFGLFLSSELFLTAAFWVQHRVVTATAPCRGRFRFGVIEAMFCDIFSKVGSDQLLAPINI